MYKYVLHMCSKTIVDGFAFVTWMDHDSDEEYEVKGVGNECVFSTYV